MVCSLTFSVMKYRCLILQFRHCSAIEWLYPWDIDTFFQCQSFSNRSFTTANLIVYWLFQVSGALYLFSFSAPYQFWFNAVLTFVFKTTVEAPRIQHEYVIKYDILLTDPIYVYFFFTLTHFKHFHRAIGHIYDCWEQWFYKIYSRNIWLTSRYVQRSWSTLYFHPPVCVSFNFEKVL